MRYHGQMALQIALLVAFTQLIPEHQVQLLGVIKSRVKVGISAQTVNFEFTSPFLTEPTDGVPDVVDGFVHSWFPMSLDHYSVWLVCRLDLSALLQKELGRVCRRC